MVKKHISKKSKKRCPICGITQRRSPDINPHCRGRNFDCSEDDDAIAVIDPVYAPLLVKPIRHCHHANSMGELSLKHCAWCTLDASNEAFSALYDRCKSEPCDDTRVPGDSFRRCRFLFRQGEHADETDFVCYVAADGRVRIRMYDHAISGMAGSMMVDLLPTPELVQDFIVS